MKKKVFFVFPDEFEGAIHFFGNVEQIESTLGIEFSCGDGRFLSEIEEDEVLFEKYDGRVDQSLAITKDGKFLSNFIASFEYNDDRRGEQEFSNIKIKNLDIAKKIKNN